MAKTGYLWDPIYLGHQTSFVHPENPKRAEALDFKNINRDLPGLENLNLNFRLTHWIKEVHGADYISLVEDAFYNKIRYLDGGETGVLKDTFDVATYSLCGALSLVQSLGSGKIKNGFAAIRPPGHHAGIHGTRGFCYFNNAAACAKFAQGYLGLKKVLIVDWDVHPGDGTMQIFYEDPDVHVFSIHQEGILSKNVGLAEQIGRGEGEGTTHNINIKPGSDGKTYIPIFEKELTRVCNLVKPEIIILSAGFDAHSGDPLGGLLLNYENFATMTDIILAMAKEYTGGKLVSLMEGGYNVPILYNCVRTHIERLMSA